MHFGAEQHVVSAIMVDIEHATALVHKVPESTCDCCRYGQAGTPRLKVETAFSSAARTLTITASQSVPATPGQQAEVPVLVPLRIALLASDGSPMPLHLEVGSCLARCNRQEQWQLQASMHSSAERIG